jgi:hypothetical protein
MYLIQSILLNKDYYTLKSATKFIYDNNFKVKKVDITDNWFRFRQVSPTTMKNKGYTKLRTKVIIPNVLQFIIGYKD